MNTKLMNEKDVASLLKVSRATVRRYARDDNSFPLPFRLSEGCTRWSLADIETWLAAKRERPMVRKGRAAKITVANHATA
jgi:prophage regulatory protein